MWDWTLDSFSFCSISFKFTSILKCSWHDINFRLSKTFIYSIIYWVKSTFWQATQSFSSNLKQTNLWTQTNLQNVYFELGNVIYLSHLTVIPHVPLQLAVPFNNINSFFMIFKIQNKIIPSLINLYYYVHWKRKGHYRNYEQLKIISAMLNL